MIRRIAVVYALGVVLVCPTTLHAEDPVPAAPAPAPAPAPQPGTGAAGTRSGGARARARAGGRSRRAGARGADRRGRAQGPARPDPQGQGVRGGLGVHARLQLLAGRRHGERGRGGDLGQQRPGAPQRRGRRREHGAAAERPERLADLLERRLVLLHLHDPPADEGHRDRAGRVHGRLGRRLRTAGPERVGQHRVGHRRHGGHRPRAAPPDRRPPAGRRCRPLASTPGCSRPSAS